MKKAFYTPLMLVTLLTVMMSVCSCNDGETYADKKKREKNAISKFITDNTITGPIKVISESQFYAQDSTTNVEENEYVLFDDDGIYMQVISGGGGKTFVEMAREVADSTVNKIILCRFLEYNIETGDTVSFNNIPHYVTTVDKMLVNYNLRGRSYTASFTEGVFASTYGSKVVPKGWLKPLDYIRLSRDTEDIARVRLIVPHSSGSATASSYVYPYFYEISYQLGR